VDSLAFLDTIVIAATTQTGYARESIGAPFFRAETPENRDAFCAKIAARRRRANCSLPKFVHICPQSFSTGRGRVLSVLANGVTALSTTVHIRYPQQ
jgi:hypothetical protein